MVSAAVPNPRSSNVEALLLGEVGLTYGTILVDLARHRPIDLLFDRSSASLAAWLRAHPGAATIARDRAGAHAEGARVGVGGRFGGSPSLRRASAAAITHRRRPLVDEVCPPSS